MNKWSFKVDFEGGGFRRVHTYPEFVAEDGELATIAIETDLLKARNQALSRIEREFATKEIESGYDYIIFGARDKIHAQDIVDGLKNYDDVGDPVGRLISYMFRDMNVNIIQNSGD